MNDKLPDVQNMQDLREKGINKVGIRELILPIQIRGASGRVINTVGDFSVYSSLSKELRGANMSRYSEVIQEAIKDNISSDIILDILERIKTKLESDDAYVKVKFNYFVKKKAPVSGKEGFVHVPCILEGRLINGEKKLYLTVKSFYSSLCPCSKEISDRGAHNQRSSAAITVEMKGSIKIENLVKLIDDNASCEIYSILKRPDEKYVTEKAYDNPKFVEDMSRDIALALDKLLDKSINDYVVVINHFESIHLHNACSIINAGRELK